MNASRRAQIRALAALDPPVSLGGGVALVNLAWRVEHDHTAPLRWWEQYELDAALWANRERLAEAWVELPSRRPERGNYKPITFRSQTRLF